MKKLNKKQQSYALSLIEQNEGIYWIALAEHADDLARFGNDGSYALSGVSEKQLENFYESEGFLDEEEY